MSGGVGYRRSDLFREQLGVRGTARATTRGGYMFDADVDFQGFRTDRTFLRWYTRYEHSPHIDYFGQGNDSLEANRTSYRYDDFSSDFNASFAVTRRVHFGGTGGYFHAHTAPSGEDDVIPIDEAFPPDSLPGLRRGHEVHAHRRVRVLRLARFTDRSAERRVVRRAISRVPGTST